VASKFIQQIWRFTSLISYLVFILSLSLFLSLSLSLSLSLVFPYANIPSAWSPMVRSSLGSSRDGLLTVAWSFVGDRLIGPRALHRKKYVKKRDIQYNTNTGKFHCPNCNNGYGRRDTMLGHYRYECGKAPRYKCPYCNLCSKKTSNIYQHIRCMHPKEQVTLVKLYWVSWKIFVVKMRD
jgi:hypothetical protein